MKILIIANDNKSLSDVISKSIFEYLSGLSHDVYFEKGLHERPTLGKTITNRDLQNIDLGIVLGGDGTILRCAHKYSKYGIPFLGINLGRVGCLAEGTPENYLETINKVLTGKFEIERRVAIEGKLIRNDKVISKFTSFNEVALVRGNMLNMLYIDIKINDRNDTKFYADGIIVATPSGSSAYCLSSGGPLLIPTSKSFVITPVCPQLRTITSLVVESDDKITISPKNDSVENPSHLPHVEIDGIKCIRVLKDDVIELEKSRQTLNIVKVNLDSSLYEPIFKVTNTFR